MEKRIFDCTHQTVNSLEKELLFKEVMALRNEVVDAHVLISDIMDKLDSGDIDIEDGHLYKRIEDFVNNETKI